MIYAAAADFIAYALDSGLITADDVYVVRNRLMELLKLSEWQEPSSEPKHGSVEDILAPLVDYACAEGIIEDTVNNRDLFDTALMGAVTPMPREIIARFDALYALDPSKATDWYYDLCCRLNYIRAGRIAKDLRWKYYCEYGQLDITINCSKPEKDPRDIAAARNAGSVSYPKCQLCPENAGYAGRADHPARQNLRPVPITVNDERWQLQYSPYGYFNEHCIAFNCEHTEMEIDRAVFGKLFDIAEYLPHYFIGSNADLPVVGGSILSHEHFQGGRYTFAMEKAPVEHEFSVGCFPKVKAGIVKWPMSVIRLSCADREELASCCGYLLDKWREYSDDSVGIRAFTGQTPHNTITPIARMKDGVIECDLVLRCNITTEDRPLGLFHPNPELHHIKKENIGLIEVMGLAVLPARLAKELTGLERAMLDGVSLTESPELTHHAAWATRILSEHPGFAEHNARGIIEDEVGKVFLNVLEDAGVFKRTPEGKAAFLRFVASLE